MFYNRYLKNLYILFYKMAYMPHKNKDLQEKFSIIPKTFSDFNNIFFNGKSSFFEKIEKNHPKEGEEFLKIYKNLKELVLNMETVLQKEYPFLKTHTEKNKIEITRKEAALLFLLSFFNCMECNSPRFIVYNIIVSKFGIAFQFGRCFLSYLTTIGKWLEEKNDEILNEKIIYIRDNCESKKYLDNKEVDLCEINVLEEGSLFDGDASYCVDFANKKIGGGALTGGRVQEEILFALQPEAIISMLFMEVMDPNDAIGIFNTIEYSKSSGYSHTFRFEKSSITDDLANIKRHRIIAIDAIFKTNSSSFFNFCKNTIQEDIIRDIHKSYVGFNLINLEEEEKEKFEKTISTGNWGCGAFGGNHELKFIQQWISASFAGVKRLDYYTFGDIKMKNAVKHHSEIKNIYKNAKTLYEKITLKKIDEKKIIINLVKNK